MSDTHSRYEQHQHVAQNIIHLMKLAHEQLASLNMAGEAASINDLCNRMSTDVFRILVLGEFKRGKSTVINALLREHILPSYSIPCTAVINEISFGETKTAELFVKDNLSNEGIAALPPEIYQHIQKHPQALRSPYRFPVERLKDYVVINDAGVGHEEGVRATPYEKVKITWPVDLCRHGIEIIDSPGLNEHGTRERVTLEYLPKADVVVFVLTCQALASMSELNFIRENLLPMGHESIFFVANRFDETPIEERETVKNHAIQRLARLTQLGENGIFFLSARDALKGHTEGDPSRVDQSGLPELERRLADYLVDNRGRVKLTQPVNQCLAYLDRALHEKIPAARAIAAQSAGELKQRYEAALPPLIDAKLRRDNILRSLEYETQELRENIAIKFMQQVNQLADSLPTWVTTAQFSEEFGVFKGEWPKAQAERIASEVVTMATTHIKSQQQAWMKSTLSPWFAARLQMTQTQAARNAQLFMTSLDNASTKLTGLSAPVSNESDSAEAALNRILQAAAGTTLTGVDGSLSSSLGGYDGLLTRVLPAVAGIITLAVIGVMIPAGLVAAIIGAAIAAAMGKSLQAAPHLRAKVADEMKKSLRSGANEQANEVAQKMTAGMNEYLQMMQIGLDREIQSVQEQVDSVRRELDSGLRNSELELAQLENRASVISVVAEKLRGSVAALGS
jgi:ribosome biogenesis GTPase A